MPTKAALAHIPGPPALPLIGHTLTIARDSYGTQQEYIRQYGPVYKTNMLGVWRVNLCGADAMERVLLDRENLFSSEGGWDALKRIYPGGLLLQDFDAHRANRRIMQAAFRASAIRDYRLRMTGAMAELFASWPANQAFDFYAAIKDLTLRLGGAVFMGLPLDGPLAKRVNQAIQDEIRASLAVIRWPIPLTPMWRGVRGRDFLRETFRALIPERRAKGGDDFFSQMCLARDEDGRGWTEDEILNQFNLLIMAAHDTTATALSVMVEALASHPDWQERLISEVAGLGESALDDDALGKMGQTNNVFREALRLVPPVPFIPRQATRDFHWRGYDIPAGTSIALNPGVTMLSPEYFSDPTAFDPDRFAPHRAEDKSHKFAWTPFGGGAHKCIGMHFSTLQVKLFVATLLRKHRVQLAGPAPQWQRMPIPKPKGGLHITLQPL
ncbi:cytochrome P450 [Roseobacter sinensis]|uniref:Cytochrome P450 n=1 Tax=Roseobacter sinensis TaxID=2931391 RepID=A0ABT3BAK0_9RHOB|nr:cytochrome P450 [Roseobacter sp. WL0113]MCV3270588.1 cytochrome P450 [Roseobacter sp. WL0113]